MQKKTLYLHIGWSKTGTSAIQQQLDAHFKTLKSEGILYSKKLQMNDNAHHHFALAFQEAKAYPAKFTPSEVMALHDKEMKRHRCHSAIISSELSPFYYQNDAFKKWVTQFKNVVVIATVRPQSEVLVSLFNQLIKDPQVRFKATFFQLTINSLGRFNYFNSLNRWRNRVGDGNIKVINYQNDVVQSFLELFDLAVIGDTKKIINPSLPTSALLQIQQQALEISNPKQYAKRRDEITQECQHQLEPPSKIWLTAGELRSIDNHYMASNNRVAREFLGQPKLFTQSDYRDIYVY
ncbi:MULTISPECIES: hypothetical protein [unclassified Vibrio]|uniref:Sulfotransferase domain-containing protein n=1 Tax=Vibrio sp. HB236076 TaxID=3232307 RepID=A0AB39HHC5_9VIBR|nr:hypothetical protein [Vibrio sp. HB161653]MDP5254350.1 hypothetical protein [Vibrio sp. HB161653]